ncbi:MAG: hypothetical protein DI586_00270 [Micavibrio aeruginosavorus]|uniref:Uncharacterized protein n=1 Tax=Micavibrio aeruginosavorus TaxID=349221 RepID=A0A2W5FNH0_9BACT|nr:MAG: hypothetical protein DI586_00270 [Micavibrio aeruginosavorus]
MNIFKYVLFVLFILIPLSSALSASEDTKEPFTQCNEGQHIQLELGKQHIKFSIPEKYFSPRDIYKKVQDPAELISVQLKKPI